MHFGICVSVGQAAAVKAGGWDFVEENVQNLLQGNVDDAHWKGMDAVHGAPLHILAANCLVPGNIKITGPNADLGKLKPYMQNVLARAQKTGIKTLVFGSGGARQIPEGVSRDKARAQIIEFVKMAAPIAAKHNVTLVAEPLNRGECNVINSVPEAMEYVRAVDHPNFQCLVDSYHFWLENEKLADLKLAMPWIKHVHVADKDGRVPPGESKKSDYIPFFGILKQGGYQGAISVEALGFDDLTNMAPRVLKFLKQQWEEA